MVAEIIVLVNRYDQFSKLVGRLSISWEIWVSDWVGNQVGNRAGNQVENWIGNWVGNIV